MNPISIAVKGKGAAGAFRRARGIARRYGYSTGRMAMALDCFASVLTEFGCSATFPITSVVLRRNPDLIRGYQAQGIEFAVHGYRHTDFSKMSRSVQIQQLSLARRAFLDCGVQARGFRSPYLRYTGETLAALREHGFDYDASQAIAWNCLPEPAMPGYKHALGFYNALSADEHPSIPRIEAGIVQIPYSLPDDESLVDRFEFDCDRMVPIWMAILERSFELGELFTVGIHPERILPCQQALQQVLQAAATKKEGAVWIARIDEIAAWWRNRTSSSVRISPRTGSGRLHIQVEGPAELAILARGVDVDAPTTPAFAGYRQVHSSSFTLNHRVRPFIGVAPGSPAQLIQFLTEQGFIVESGLTREAYTHFIDMPAFGLEKRRELLEQLERPDRPLVRLGRWPNAARSALSITGDIDALTRWDYGLRFFGR